MLIHRGGMLVHRDGMLVHEGGMPVRGGGMLVCGGGMLIWGGGMFVRGGQKAHYEMGGSEEGVRRGYMWPHLLGIYFRDKLDSSCVLVFEDKLGSNVMCLGLSDHSFNTVC